MKFYINNAPFAESVSNYFERFFLIDFTKELSKTLGSNSDWGVYFYLNLKAHELPLPSYLEGATNICVIIDEYYSEDESLLNTFTCVFQAYLSCIKTPHRYFHFPLGYGAHFIPSPIIPLSERPYNAFFSGNLHRGRKEFLRALTPIGYLPFSVAHRIQHLMGKRYDSVFQNSYIRFTKNFSTGLGPEEYSSYLHQSKIIITPPGIVNTETFRLYEALKAGCVVISSRLPSKPFYQEIPAVFIDDWRDLKRTINTLLLRTSQEWDDHQKIILQYWERNLSATAAARKMVELVRIRS